MKFSALLAAVASTTVSGQWTIVASDLGTISTGCAFVNATTGYLPVLQNGVGPSIQKTTDAGQTWNDDETAAPFALLLLDIAAHAGADGNDNVAVVGALAMEFSTDGAQTFNESLAPLGAGQCIRNIADTPGAFAAVGQWGLASIKNGPAISYDSGAIFVAVNDTTLDTDARYGAFPTKNTWFISAGTWAGEGADDNPPCDDPPCVGLRPRDYMNEIKPGSELVKKQSARVHLIREPDGKIVWGIVKRGHLHSANLGVMDPSNWTAAISRTTDAGSTWETVFELNGQFYFNGIECSSDQDCCAVAEDQGNNVTSDDGTYIYCTSDGGATWTENYRNTDGAASLTDIAALSPQEYWAVGAELGSISPLYPTFFHTVDAGKTWSAGTGTVEM